MKNKWALEAKRRIGADFERLGTVIITQRAAVSERYRKMCGLSKTQMNKALPEQNSWLRTQLTRLNILEVVLERWRLLGKLVWWLYDRMMARMKKPLTMRPVGGVVPPDQRGPTKGAEDGVDHAVDPQAVPKA